MDNSICFTGNGLVLALMEPHLTDDAGADQTQVATAFLVFGAAFAVGSITAGCVSFVLVISCVGIEKLKKIVARLRFKTQTLCFPSVALDSSSTT